MVKPVGKQGSDSTRQAKVGINDIPGSEIYEEDDTEIQDDNTSWLEERESAEVKEPSRKQAFMTKCISGSEISNPEGLRKRTCKHDSISEKT